MNVLSKLRRYGIRTATVAFLVLTGQTARASAIVSNQGSSSEDSVLVSILNWDSTGCSPLGADSFWVLVLKSGDNDCVFKDSGTTSMEGLDSVVIAGNPVYYFHRPVADIDGSGANGLYAGELIAKNTSLGLYNTSPFGFQVVGWELNAVGDSAVFAATLYDSLISQGALLDSLYALLDSIQSQASWVSAFDAGADAVHLEPDAFTEMADTIFGRDSSLYDEGYWHKIAERADSGSAGGGPDSASVAGWVWNSPQNNHTGAGTFGKYLDTEISGIASGSGMYSHSVLAYDSSAALAVPGVSTVVRNLDQTSLLATGATDADGMVSFNLNAGNYLLIASAGGYLFAAYDTIVVAGNGVDTVYGSHFDPGTPSGPNLCRVYGHLYDVSGVPEQGVTVTAALPAGVAQFDGGIVSPNTVSTVTDEEGYFYIDVIPSDLLTPSGTIYELSVSRSDGTILRRRMAVPDAGDWRLTW